MDCKWILSGPESCVPIATTESSEAKRRYECHDQHLAWLAIPVCPFRRPKWHELDGGKDYYAVFFHGLLNVSMPLHIENMSTTIPPQLEPKGIYSVVIADEEGAPTKDSVVAGPLILLEEPEQVGLSLIG